MKLLCPHYNVQRTIIFRQKKRPLRISKIISPLSLQPGPNTSPLKYFSHQTTFHKAWFLGEVLGDRASPWKCDGCKVVVNQKLPTPVLPHQMALALLGHTMNKPRIIYLIILIHQLTPPVTYTATTGIMICATESEHKNVCNWYWGSNAVVKCLPYKSDDCFWIPRT